MSKWFVIHYRSINKLIKNRMEKNVGLSLRIAALRIMLPIGNHATARRQTLSFLFLLLFVHKLQLLYRRCSLFSHLFGLGWVSDILRILNASDPDRFRSWTLSDCIYVKLSPLSQDGLLMHRIRWLVLPSYFTDKRFWNKGLFLKVFLKSNEYLIGAAEMLPFDQYYQVECWINNMQLIRKYANCSH